MTGFVLGSTRQHIASGSVSNHGSIAAIAGSIPDVLSFCNDTARYGFPIIVHIAREVKITIKSRSIAIVIAQKGEERINIFCLVVTPQSGIITFATGTVHRAAGCLINAFAGPDLGEGKHSVDYLFGTFKHQVAEPLLHQVLALLQFIDTIQRQFLFALLIAISLHRGRECHLTTLRELQGMNALYLANNRITAFHAFLLKRFPYATLGREFYQQGILRRVGERHHDEECRLIHRRETLIQCLQAIRLVSGTYLHDALEANALHRCSIHRTTVYKHSVQRIPFHATHQTGMRIVGNCAQHRPHHAQTQIEPAIGLDAVTHHGRNTLAAHFDMVMMRQTTIGFPLNATIRQHSPTILCMTHHHSQQGKKCY